MSWHETLVQTLLQGGSNANIRFNGLCAPMQHLAFEERMRGSHHFFDKR